MKAVVLTREGGAQPLAKPQRAGKIVLDHQKARAWACPGTLPPLRHRRPLQELWRRLTQPNQTLLFIPEESIYPARLPWSEDLRLSRQALNREMRERNRHIRSGRTNQDRRMARELRVVTVGVYALFGVVAFLAVSSGLPGFLATIGGMFGGGQ